MVFEHSVELWEVEAFPSFHHFFYIGSIILCAMPRGSVFVKEEFKQAVVLFKDKLNGNTVSIFFFLVYE